MVHEPCLEELRAFVDALQADAADRNTVLIGQKALAVFDWMEKRLDVLDERVGA